MHPLSPAAGRPPRGQSQNPLWTGSDFLEAWLFEYSDEFLSAGLAGFFAQLVVSGYLGKLVMLESGKLQLGLDLTLAVWSLDLFHNLLLHHGDNVGHQQLL